MHLPVPPLDSAKKPRWRRREPERRSRRRIDGAPTSRKLYDSAYGRGWNGSFENAVDERRKIRLRLARLMVSPP
jgi:hypothetical protein